jgi:hypothetical protein
MVTSPSTLVTASRIVGSAGIQLDPVQLTNLEDCDGVTGQKKFTFGGMTETWVVPPCVTEIQIEAYGAQGGDSNVGPSAGGLGGQAGGILAVTPGETLHINVGEKGLDSSGGNAGVAGSFNGGGAGGVSIGGASQPGGAAGGGATDLRQGGMNLASRVIVAAGGGGAAGGTVGGPANGGAGGGFDGGPGTSYASGVGFEAHGGTQTMGGAAGTLQYGPMNGTPGELGLGGDGHGLGYSGGGGGGGGLYGGGGGSTHYESGGGGGSSLILGLMQGMTQPGVHTGHGALSVSW